MNNAKEMVTPLKQKTRTDLRTMQVVADHAQIDETWSKYGYSGFPIMATNVKGEVGESTRYKAYWQKSNAFPEPTLRCVIPRVQPFIPMEAVEDIITGFEKRLTDTFPEAKKRGFKIEHIIRKHSNKGNTQHWIVQTNAIENIKNSYQKDDDVKLGFVVKNGYDTGVALGINIFSFRLLCSNGAVARGQDFETSSIRHIGKDPKQLLKLFQTGLLKAVEGWRELIELYNKMAKVKLNEKMARYIYDNADTPNKFFPDYYQIATPKEIKEKPKTPVIALTSKGKSVTLWENFNDMTYELWRAKDPHKEENNKGEKVERPPVSFREIAYRETKLHSAMSNILSNQSDFN
jgi:hypothetical protein